jgi:hypothetical protein
MGYAAHQAALHFSSLLAAVLCIEGWAQQSARDRLCCAIHTEEHRLRISL